MQKKAISQYSQEMVKQYAKQGEEAGAVRTVIIPSAIAAWELPYDPSMKLIDLGCGCGPYARLMRTITGGKVVGYDLNPDMIKTAKEYEAKEPLGIQYFVYDLTQDPMKEPGIAALAPYDFAYSGWTYSEAADLPSLQAMAQSSSQLLKTGGVLVGVIDSPFLHPSKYWLFH